MHPIAQLRSDKGACRFGGKRGHKPHYADWTASLNSAKAVLRVAIIVSATVVCACAQTTPAERTNSSRADVKSLIQEARTAALHVKNDFQRGLVLDEVGVLQATAQDFDGALTTARTAYPHTTQTLRALGKVLSQNESSLNAISPRLKPGEASTIFYSVAMDGVAQGNVAKALASAKRIPTPEVRSSALREIAQAQAASGDEAGARSSLEEANRLYASQRSSEADDLMSVAEGQLARGDSSGARRTIDRISEKEMRSAALISGAEQLNKKEDAVSASVWLSDALKGLPQGRGTEFIRYMAIPLQVKLGDVESAGKFAETTTADMRVKAFGAIAVTCAEQKGEKCLAPVIMKIRALSTSSGSDDDMTAFAAKLQLLNVSAALIEHGQLAIANELLDFIQANMDDISKLSLQREVQLERAVILAKQNEFAHCRDFALKMQPNSIADVQRGTALRTLAFLQTTSQGAAATRSWATSLHDPEDRAYTLLGMAQAILGVGDIRLPYSAINIH
jgi:hypothetical protein